MKNVYSAYYNHKVVNGVTEVTLLVSDNLDYIHTKTDEYSLATLDEVNEYVKQCDPCVYGETIVTQDGIARWNSRIGILETNDKDIEFETGEYILVEVNSHGCE